MKLNNAISIEQRQQLSQNQVQSLQILACTNEELQDLLENEYTENPMLEHTGPEHDDFFANLDSLYEKGAPHPSAGLSWDDDDQRRNDIPSRPTDELRQDLLAQLPRSRYSAQEWHLFVLLIDCLDDSGFFPWEIGEIARLSGCPEEMVENCLAQLRRLEPAGIFSRDLSECLLYQLEQQQERDPVLLAMVRDYLPDLLKGQIGNVSRALHLSTTAVRQYLLQIGKLNPRPLCGGEQQSTEYLVPDLLLTRKNGEWSIALNDRWMGSYQLNQYYIHMMEQSREKELTAYFKSHLERARFLLRCVEQRRTTVLNITREILKRQQGFFESRALLQPMTMQELADALQIHSSTVSRAVRGKYLQYPGGSVLMKELFQSCVPEQENSARISVGQVHAALSALVAGEDKGRPLSDLELSRLLEQQGTRISRRTVAKYRGELGIPNSDQRRYL